MYLLATSLLIGGGIALGITLVIHTRSVFQKKKELKQNIKQMEHYYQEIQNQIKELDDFKEITEGTLDELNELTQSLSHKEKKKQVETYITNLKTRYQNLEQLFFCADYLFQIMRWQWHLN